MRALGEGEIGKWPVAELGLRYRRYRLADEAGERDMVQSLRRHGQITPLVVCRREETLEVLDGFKRVVAAVELGLVHLRCQVLAADERITAWAQQLRDAGLEGGLDELRARAYLDLLLGKDSRPGASPPGTPGAAPAGFASRVTLTAPLATLTRLADRPGELAGLGPVDPWLTRDLATAAARNPRTTWCLTVTDN